VTRRSPPSMTTSELRRREYGAALTAAQHEALRLLSHGLTDQQVGTRLDISHHSVKSRLRRAYARLGALDRAHAVRLGFEGGLLYAGDMADALRQVDAW
jgi:DNA-binding CsgD family transcriptional regulator